MKTPIKLLKHPSNLLLAAILLAGPVAAETALPFDLQEDSAFPNGQLSTPIGELEFKGGYPSTETVDKLYDAIDFQRASQAYLWSLPLVAFADWQHEWRKQGAGDLDIVTMVSYKQKLGLITPNLTTPYYVTFTDMNNTGPLVVETPPGALAGGVLDFWQRLVTDIGLTGPDQGKGGKYLILPPGSDAIAPEGFTVIQSSTMNIFPAFRIIEADPKAALALASKIRIYPYAQRDKPPVTRIIQMTEEPWSQAQPRGLAYWQRLSDTINREPVQERDRIMMAMLKPLGIEKGKPFNPDARQKRILLQGALVGEAMAKANTYDKRIEGPFWEGTHWKNAIAMDYTQEAPNYTELDERAAWFYEATTSSRGMKITEPGPGQAYISSYKDSTGEWLDGGKSYSLHLPANIPASQFWSVTLYSADNRRPIINGTDEADLSARNKLVPNADGSLDLYFGPQAPEGKETNWLKTVPGQGWFTYFRLYGPKQPFFDKSWKLDDFKPL